MIDISILIRTWMNLASCRSRIGRTWRLFLFFLLATAAAVKADDFTYEIDEDTGTITITKYTGSGGAVSIPPTIDGTNVTSIGYKAFYSCTSLTSVTIPDSVTSIGIAVFDECGSLTNMTIGSNVTAIGESAFAWCTSLPAITVNASNSIYCSMAGVLFNKDQTTLIQYPGGKTGSDYMIANSVTSIGPGAFVDCTNLTSVTIPDSVTSIGDSAFSYCTSLADVTIPDSVTNIGVNAFYSCASLDGVTIPNSITIIGDGAFSSCTNLTGVFFKGNAPGFVGSDIFSGADNATVFYLPGATGWETPFGGLTPVLWSPRIPGDANFGVLTNGFGFAISATNNLVAVVDACTNLVNPVWSPVGTNTFRGDTSYFNDLQWTNHPVRFYRLRMP